MHKVTVDGWKWASHDKNEYSPDTTSIDFTIYKKGFLGGLKKVRGDYALMLKVDKNNFVDVDSMAIHEFDSGILPFNAQLAYGVMQAAVLSMEQAGENEKANAMREASSTFFKTRFLKNY